MVRWLFLFLPLCLVLQDQPSGSDEPAGSDATEVIPVEPAHIFFKGTDLLRQEILAATAYTPIQSFPGSIPWEPMHHIGAEGLYPVEVLMHYHPELFLEMCLARYEREVRGYSAKFIKHERIAGKLQPREKLEVHFREEPFSV